MNQLKKILEKAFLAKILEMLSLVSVLKVNLVQKRLEHPVILKG